MKKGTWIALVIIIVALLIGSFIDNDKERETGPIKIGAPTSLTGVAAAFGEMAQMGMELAVEEINGSGGVNGRMVELYIEDDQTSASAVVSAYQKLVGLNKVDAIIGSQFDFVTQPLFPIALQDEITVISPTNFVIEGSFEMNDHSFVMYPHFSQIIGELKSVIKEREIKKIGIIRFQSDFGAEIEKTLNKIMENIGGEPVVSITYAEIGGSDFRTETAKAREAGIEAVFLDTLDFDTLKFLKRANEIGFSPLVITHTTVRDALANPDVDPTLMEGIVMLDWEISSEEFKNKFESKYGVIPQKSSNKAYDAIYVTAEAIANTENKSAVAQYIESHEFETINGKFSFSSDHGLENTPVEIFEIKDGEFIKFSN